MFVRVHNTITKKDVARLAGVSHMTVSRVLSGYAHVSPELRDKVQRACTTLNYRRNTAASTLRSRRSHAIGVAVPTFRHMFFARLLNAVEEACRANGYHFVATQGRLRDGQLSALDWEDMSFLLGRQLDGLIIDVALPPDALAKLKAERVPVVFVDCAPDDPAFNFVGTADADGMAELTEHLIDLGHRDIAFLGGNPEIYTGSERLRGFKRALARRNLKVNKDLLRVTNFQMDGGHAGGPRPAGAGQAVHRFDRSQRLHRHRGARGPVPARG